jgi:uncharacterized protein
MISLLKRIRLPHLARKKEPVNTEAMIHQVRDYVLEHSYSGHFHGIDHWDRVYKNGLQLITPDVNPLVVGLFAYLHDACREDDGEDYQHGPRAAGLVDKLRNTLLKDVYDEDIYLLKEACRLHTVSLKTGNPTIDVCFDADRLDLGRVGIIPDPDKLATEKGKEIARKLFVR